MKKEEIQIALKKLASQYYDKNKKAEWKESLIVWGVLTFIFLPVRLIFYNLVSTNWFGSFGLISGISILIVLLVEKQKLGKFGVMFKNQMMKLNKGKSKYAVYIMLLLKIFLLANIIFAVEIADVQYKETKTEIAAVIPDYSNVEEYQKELENAKPQDYLLALLAIGYLYIYDYDILASMISVFNDQTHGFYLHIVTVGFVELLELLGVLIWYKIRFKDIKQDDTYNRLLLYEKTRCWKHARMWGKLDQET